MFFSRHGGVALLASAISVSALGAAPAPPAPAINFQRQVRSILSDNCFLCHGPDKGTRMADLRLDIKEGAFATRKNGTVIVPGRPDDSLLMKRISSDNPAYRMPPVFSHKTLTPQQKEILRAWIAQGAQWKDHWAFIPPAKPTPPEVKNTAWVRNPVDQFILARLEANGLQPAPEADRHELIRRVTLDLTGLPPTPAEVNAFVKDKSPDAYEKVVDRLFASPHYGEHRARYWLDAARYADTHGLHIDNFREMWPYRDWVIHAFNSNMPFDRFTVEQIAGDLLPNPTLDQRIATGFHRCNVSTNEGGTIPEEVAAIYAKDRADTTGTVWLGLTVGCATCHDHKFDPISQKDYYSLTAFFRNTTQNPMDGNVPDTPPSILVPRDEDRQAWSDLRTKREALTKTLADAKQHPDSGFDAWLQSTDRRSALQGPVDGLALSLDQAPAVSVNGKSQPVTLPDTVHIAAVAGHDRALQFGKEASVPLPHVPGIDVDKPFTLAAWVYLPKAKQTYVVASSREAKADSGNSDKRPGWVMEIASEAPVLRLMSGDGKYLSARPRLEYELKPNTWYHVAFTYDGTRRREGIKLFVDGKFVPSYGVGEDLNPLEGSIGNDAPIQLGGEDKRYFPEAALADFRVLNRHIDEADAELLAIADTVRQASAKQASQLTDSEREALATYYVDNVNSATKDAVAELRRIDTERDAIIRRGATTLVMQERTDTKPIAHVLYRGQYDQKRDEVSPNVPSVLPPMTQSMPRNRLGLAEWLVDPSNPLTARVTVNRFWQEVFGTGIVKTTEDFGSQGEPPSHPELLDWLAVEYRESGWDTKKFFRLLVTSATYRQSSEATDDKIQKDPDNRLLARGPRFRMDGEMVRDYALAASGLLVPTVGGPSAKPYQPANVWETVAMDASNTRFYKADTGDKLYRRSLYTFWKRSAPPASMDIFNAPSRETCTVRRERTNTPLQALVTMNDPQFVEAARALAQSALLSSKSKLDRQVEYMANRLLARNLNTKERDVVVSSYRDYLAYYDSKPDDAQKLLSVGESKCDSRLPKDKLAALTMVANELMNLDEVLVK